MNPIKTVGMIGLGKMGYPMTKHLVARGFTVVGSDVAAAACDKAKAEGARIVASPREVAAASDLVIVVVGFDREVEDAIFGANGITEGGKPDLIVAIGSTVAPRFAKRIGARMEAANIVPLDIPLTRG
ncbi:MAG: NAD(P)-binding domain-containing protein [Burkholderiales bacterium]